MTGSTTRVLNLTPHTVVVLPEKGGSGQIAPSGAVARVSTVRRPVAELRLGDVVVPVVHERGGDVVHLPAQEPDTVLIVSRAVAIAARQRPDLLVPTELVRDEAGAVVACRALATIADRCDKA